VRQRAHNLGRRLAEARQEQGLTQEELARRAGTAVSTVRKIESGATAEPGFFTVAGIAGALDLTLDGLESGPSHRGAPSPGNDPDTLRD